MLEVRARLSPEGETPPSTLDPVAVGVVGGTLAVELLRKVLLLVPDHSALA